MLVGAKSYQTPTKDTSILIPSIGKLSYDGDSLWYYTFSFRSGLNIRESFHDIIATSDGGYLVVGESILFDSEDEDLPWTQSILLKVDSTGHLDTTSVSVLNIDEENISLYPNPSNNIIYLKQSGSNPLYIEIIDNLGRVVDKYISHSNNHTIALDISGYSNGVYNVIARMKNTPKLNKARFIKIN